MNKLINLPYKIGNSVNKASILQVSGIIKQTKFRYSQNVTEDQIKTILRKKFPSSQAIQVEDVSGGCGAMFNIYIESNDFKGLSIPKQHRIVYDTLKEQIQNIHGLHLETKIPSS